MPRATVSRRRLDEWLVDRFDREVAVGWGKPDIGQGSGHPYGGDIPALGDHWWDLYRDGSSTFSVAGDLGRIVCAADSTYCEAWAYTDERGNPFSSDLELSAKVRFDTAPTSAVASTGFVQVGLYTRYSNSAADGLHGRVQFGTDGSRFASGRVASLDQQALALVVGADTDIWLKWSIVGTTSKLKCWLASAAEPDWQFTDTVDGIAADFSGVAVEVATGSAFAVPVTFDFSEIRAKRVDGVTTRTSVSRGAPTPIVRPTYAPVISNVTAVVVTQTSAIVSWDVDQFATGQVEYGTTDAYGSTTTAETSFSYNSHAQAISGLTANTLYHYRVRSTNAEGQETVSGDGTFTTFALGAGFDDGMTYTDYTPPLDITTISALQTWLDATVKNAAGSWSTTVHKRVMLGTGRTYTGSVGLNVAGYSHVTFEGGGTEVTYEVTVTPYGGGTPLDVVTGSQTGGAEFVVNGVATSTATSAIRSVSGASVVPADDLRFHAFHTEGNQTLHATTGAGNAGAERQMSFLLYGATNILIDHVSADRMKGDFVYLSDSANGSGTWCDNITVRYSHCANNGRQGIAIIAATDVLAEHNRFTDIAMGPLDIEPNNSTQGCSNVEFSRNLIDGTYYSWDSLWNDPWFQTNNENADNCTISGYLKAIDNGLTAGMNMTGVTSQPAIGIYKPTGTTKTALLTITGNTSSAPKAVSFGCTVGGFINGGAITNNKGFLSSGTWYNDIGGNGSITQTGNT